MIDSKTKAKVITDEIIITVQEEFPDFQERVRQLLELGKIEDREEFIDAYKSITGASDFDLPEEIFL
jgi:uncharacterized protein YhaN